MTNQSAHTKFCVSCGTPLIEGQKFCGNCGAKVPESQPETAVKVEIAPPPRKNSSLAKPIAVLVIFFVIFLLVRCGTDRASAPDPHQVASTPEVQQVSGCAENFTKCKDNADLINNNKSVIDAKAACQTVANQSVRYGAPDWSWVPFGKFIVGSDFPKTGVVHIVDDDVKISNAFGAMEKSEVRCKYDIKKSKILLLIINGEPVVYDDIDGKNDASTP